MTEKEPPVDVLKHCDEVIARIDGHEAVEIVGQIMSQKIAKSWSVPRWKAAK